ncbi:MAG: efflux RND transporter periplasmic adaptor subunit [Legionella sp.]|nr:efflux RND transporter periplasmic adaptor subunit [Legionella sp.]
MLTACKTFLSRKKPMTLMIIGLSIVFGGLILFNISKKIALSYFFKHYKPPAVSVASVTVKEENWQPNLHAVGAFVAVNGVDINSESTGNITAIHFTSGESVKKDVLLVDIEDSIDQATLKSNQANLTLQKVNYKRQAQLMKKNATSQSEVDSAKAEMLEALAKVEQTEANIRHKHIRTPCAGRLGIRLVNLGQYVTPGKTKIVTLQSLDPLFLEFHIPEQLIPKIHLDQNIFFSVEPDTNKLFAGKITAINAKADTQTHNVKIQASIANCPSEVFSEKKPSELIQTKKIPYTNRTEVICHTQKNQAAHLKNYAFLPGMFASIEIEQPVMSKSLVLPTTAISYSLYGDSVFLITPELTVKRVFVTTGDEQGNQIVITKGLKAGDHVVSAGEVKLQDGTHVVINNHYPLNTSKNTSNLSE